MQRTAIRAALFSALMFGFPTTMCFASSLCRDPNQRSVEIGGNFAEGWVGKHNKPLVHAEVLLYSSSGKIIWSGITDDKGTFSTSELLPGDYRIVVSGWGSAHILLNPDLDRQWREKYGQASDWWLILSDHNCISYMQHGN
jgi:hypothetical protein